jgi:hypothetical protein
VRQDGHEVEDRPAATQSAGKAQSAHRPDHCSPGRTSPPRSRAPRA